MKTISILQIYALNTCRSEPEFWESALKNYNLEIGCKLAQKFVCTLALVFLCACTNTSSNSLDTNSNKGSRSKSGTIISGGSAAGDLQVVNRLPPPPNTREGKDQLIALNDLLEIDVFQVDSLDKTVRVDSTGRISLPLIGGVAAAGMTLDGLEKELERKYGANYLQSPDISVFLKESTGSSVTVDGQVLKPGVYPVSTGSSLLQVIALAGGFNPIADETKLYVYRQFNDKKLVANYSVKSIREGKLHDPKIYGGDVIVSFSSSSKVAAKNLREALGIAASATRVAPLL